MRVGIYSTVFGRPSLGEVLDAVLGVGVRAVQLNLRSAGLDTLPGDAAAEVWDAIGATLRGRDVDVAAVSGTFNMIDPHPTRRSDGQRRLAALIAACPRLGARVVTICSGTRDPENMWRPHPDNGSAQAWRDLTASLAAVLPAAEASGVQLAVEPEVSNVVDSAPRARRLLDEMRSPALKIVIDGANLFHRGDLQRMDAVLDEAFALLGPDVVLAHAKDLTRDGAAGDVPAGLGRLDYGRYLRLLGASGFRGAIVLHGLTEAQTASRVAFLRAGLTQVGTGESRDATDRA